MELKKVINALLIYSLILILILLIFFFYKKYNSNLTYSNQLIPVKVTLNNKCELIDDAFMVVSKETNKSAFFFEKKAYLQLPRVDKVTLAASSKYPGFHLTENWVDVEAEITLTSDCSAKTKQEMIIDSMREQFKKD